MYVPQTDEICMQKCTQKYALKYTPILSVFERKIFIQFRQRFSQENEVSNLQSAPKDQDLIIFRKK